MEGFCNFLRSTFSFEDLHFWCHFVFPFVVLFLIFHFLSSFIVCFLSLLSSFVVAVSCCFDQAELRQSNTRKQKRTKQRRGKMRRKTEEKKRDWERETKKKKWQWRISGHFLLFFVFLWLFVAKTLHKTPPNPAETRFFLFFELVLFCWPNNKTEPPPPKKKEGLGWRGAQTKTTNHKNKNKNKTTNHKKNTEPNLQQWKNMLLWQLRSTWPFLGRENVDFTPFCSKIAFFLQLPADM